MTQLKVGDVIKDNDPRMDWRPPLTIREVGTACVKASYSDEVSMSLTTIGLGRIHTDGKPRRSGFDLAQDHKEIS